MGTSAFRLGLWAMVLAPAAIILHELAHFLVALSLGFDATLHAGYVSGVPIIEPFEGRAFASGLIAIAGPLLTLSLIAVGMVAFRRTSRPPWALALVAVVPARMLTSVMFLVQLGFAWSGIAERSKPNFDEVVAARAFAIPEGLLALVSAAAMIGTWVWVFKAAQPGRFRQITAMLIGGALGVFLWLRVVGPTLLP